MTFKVISNSHILTEMAKVGTFDDVDVLVWSNDPGKIPHFHIIDSNSRGNEFHCCIEIKNPKYFFHDGKEDTLNSRDIKDLIKFLNSSSNSKRFSSFTNWQVLVTLWNMNNSDIEIDEDIEMPDYTLLNRY